MKAVDTNILVRWITRDDPVQSVIADRIMADPIYISATVLLELVWVLGGRTYRYDRPTLAAILRLILRTETVSVSNSGALAWAVERFATGGDIADMIHIVASQGNDAFVSFESDLAHRAGAATPVPIERPV